MPITQDRMAAVIRAARAYKDLYEAQCADIKQALNAADPATALADLFSSVARQVIPAEYSETIVKEEQHFRHTQRQNLRRKLHMRRVRRGEHIPRAMPLGRAPAPSYPDEMLAQAVGQAIKTATQPTHYTHGYDAETQWGALPEAEPLASDADLALEDLARPAAVSSVSQVHDEPEAKEGEYGDGGQHGEEDSTPKTPSQ